MVRDQQLQRFGELVAIGVVQAGVALPAVLHEDLAPRVRQYGRADRERFEREDKKGEEAPPAGDDDADDLAAAARGDSKDEA